MDFTAVRPSSFSSSMMTRSGMSSLDLSQLSLATGASTTASSSTSSLASAANGHHNSSSSHHGLLSSGSITGWGSVHSRAAYTDLSSLQHQQQSHHYQPSSFAAQQQQGSVPPPPPRRTTAPTTVPDTPDDEGWGYYVDTPDSCFSHS